MKFKTKSAVIGRKPRKAEDDETRPCFISLFDENDPHRKGVAPKHVEEFECYRIVFKGLEVKYIPLGNDIVLNNLSELILDKDGDTVTITGKQG